MLTNKPKESRLSDWFMRGLLPGASPGEELQTKHVPHSASHHHLKKQETDTWRVFPLILFPQIIESNAKWEKAKEGENFQQKKKLYALAFGKVRWVTSVRERWANLEAAVPIQTTILASFHCQHLRLESDFSTLCSQFLFPPFFPPHMICPCPRSLFVFHRLHRQNSQMILRENKPRHRCSSRRTCTLLNLWILRSSSCPYTGWRT